MTKKIPRQAKKIFPVLLQFKDHLVKEYGERLEKVILYGSYARGTAQEDSDIDLLIVFSEMESAFKEIDRLTEIKYGLMLEYDILLSTNPVTRETLAHSKLPLFKNILKEGILV